MKTKRGPSKKLGEHERFRIERIAEDGMPTAPRDVKAKAIKQCGVIVRDCIPITIREWNRPNAGGIRYVGDGAKDILWKKLLVNFTLPTPEVDPDEPNAEEMVAQQKSVIEQKVKRWALKKMAELFKNWKKRERLLPTLAERDHTGSEHVFKYLIPTDFSDGLWSQNFFEASDRNQSQMW